MTKTCTKCGVVKPLSDYYRIASRGKYRADCKSCVNKARPRKQDPHDPTAFRLAETELRRRHPEEFEALYQGVLRRESAALA